MLIDLPDRLDDRQLAEVEHIAGLPVPAVEPAGEGHFLKCMRTLTLLPSRQEDDLSAELRLALYRKHFGHYPDQALSFLVEHATIGCTFFPTPSECRAILNKWSRQDGPFKAQAMAHARARRERQARLDDIMARFRNGEVSQEEADALPDRWKRIAAAAGHLRDGGTYAVRPVRRVDIPEGQGPLSHGTNTPGRGKMAGQPHERTDR